MRFGTVSRNDRFHKVQVEIFQCVERRRSHAAGSWPQVRSNKGKPEVAHHSYSGAQPRGWTARMVFKKLFYVLFYSSRQLFDRKRRHTTETAVGRTLDFKLREKSTGNAMRSRVALRKPWARLFREATHRINRDPTAWRLKSLGFHPC